MHPLQLLIEDTGFECCSYSGRGMFGKQCLGVVLERPRELGVLVSGLMEACVYAGGPDETQEAREAMEGMCWDSMGLGVIYYWPAAPFTSDDEG